MAEIIKKKSNSEMVKKIKFWDGWDDPHGAAVCCLDATPLNFFVCFKKKIHSADVHGL